MVMFPFAMSGLWAVFTLVASVGQTLRNAMQRDLTARLGTLGATHVRFLFGLPFSILFLAISLVATGSGLPDVSISALGAIFAGAVSQILATALMLATMRSRSFVVTTAYTKTEPVQVAIFGFAFLGDHVSLAAGMAILIATAGVILMSLPASLFQRGKAFASVDLSDWKPALTGIVAGGLFALSAIAFRAGILRLPAVSFVVAASTVLVMALFMQTFLMTSWLLVMDRPVLGAIMRAWRPSMLAGFMGAFASQFWFLAFAIQSAAKVRTLALVEVIFAQIVSRRLFRQGVARHEILGMAMIVLGVIVLLNV